MVAVRRRKRVRGSCGGRNHPRLLDHVAAVVRVRRQPAARHTRRCRSDARRRRRQQDRPSPHQTRLRGWSDTLSLTRLSHHTPLYCSSKVRI